MGVALSAHPLLQTHPAKVLVRSTLDEPGTVRWDKVGKYPLLSAISQALALGSLVVLIYILWVLWLYLPSAVYKLQFNGATRVVWSGGMRRGGLPWGQRRPLASDASGSDGRAGG